MLEEMLSELSQHLPIHRPPDKDIILYRKRPTGRWKRLYRPDVRDQGPRHRPVGRLQISDIAQAMHEALVEHLGEPPWSAPFHMITHSTGALVVKDWIVRHYLGAFAEDRPLRNVVFLAGPHFGSRLAHHGRSMLSHAVYFGDTGGQVLKSLELGSAFSWSNNEAWLDPAHWRENGVRPFCLIGDRVEGNLFKSKIFPAGFEKGSDMVVRVPAGNLNHRRFRLDGRDASLSLVGEISKVPFAALGDYVHSGHRHGIMNSITTDAKAGTAATPTSLGLIVTCLEVSSQSAYRRVFDDLARETARTQADRRV